MTIFLQIYAFEISVADTTRRVLRFGRGRRCPYGEEVTNVLDRRSLTATADTLDLGSTYLDNIRSKGTCVWIWRNRYRHWQQKWTGLQWQWASSMLVRSVKLLRTARTTVWRATACEVSPPVPVNYHLPRNSLFCMDNTWKTICRCVTIVICFVTLMYKIWGRVGFGI
jgi:hypothetical protein